MNEYFQTDLLLAQNLAIILTIAFIGGSIARFFKLPTLIGYLSIGLLTGGILRQITGTIETITSLAQIGVALLLFTVGLEFSLSRIQELKRLVLFGSISQVVGTILVLTFLLPLFGIDYFTAFLFGTIVSLSSTAISVKLLSDKGEMESLHGALSSGWLLMQDLYTIPLILIVPIIGRITTGNGIHFDPSLILIRSLVLGLLLLGTLFLVGKPIILFIAKHTALMKSRELTITFALVVCLFMAFLFENMGFSFVVGAFVAGLLLSTSSVNHGIFAEIRPLRDLFSIIFFVSLGLMIDPLFLVPNILPLLLITLTVVLLKGFIMNASMMILGYHTKPSFLTATTLTNIGEFAFIIALSVYRINVIPEYEYQLILSVCFLSLMVSIPLIGNGVSVYNLIGNIMKLRLPFAYSRLKKLDHRKTGAFPILTDHIVVLGHGRVGKYICRALKFSELPFIVVDYDPTIINELKKEQINVLYGDPMDTDVLRFAGVKRARAVVLAFSDREVTKPLVANIANENPHVQIFVRSHHEEDAEKLKSLGARTVIQPEFEAALTLTQKILTLFNVEEKEIEGKLHRLKIEHGMA
jgi:monovalent cation:H+ antiporter-2, CPA2 family